MNSNLQTATVQPRPSASLLIPVSLRIPARQTVPAAIPVLDPLAGRKAYAALRASWAEFSLRQSWADEAHMRAHLKAAAIRVPDSAEPATAVRVKALLRKIKLTGPEIAEAVGTGIAGFLKLNTGLPLWAAVALILEATGRFTVEASA